MNTDKTKNIMITNVSNLNFASINESKYELNDNDTVGVRAEGIFTNEAPIKLMMKKLNYLNKGKDNSYNKLDEIILIESDKAKDTIPGVLSKKEITELIKEDKDNNKKLTQYKFVQYMDGETEITTVNYLKKKIKDTAFEYGCEVPELKEISIPNEPDDKEVVKCIMDVQDELVRIAEKYKSENINVYIEANGGIRYVMVMLTSIMNVLQSQYDNIQLKSVLSTIYDSSGVSKVSDTKSTYISAQLVAAVNEFTNYGRIFSLKNYFEMRKSIDIQKDDWMMWNDIMACIAELSKISDALQLCRSTKILELFYGINGSKEKGIKTALNNFKTEYKDSDNADAKVFIYVINIILKQFESIYSDVDKNKDAINNLPRLIKWCVEKDYVQQAITIYIEKMPDYYFSKGYISKDIVNLEKIELAPQDSSKTSKGFYNILYDYCAGCVEDEKEETLQDTVKKKILELWNKVANKKDKAKAYISELDQELNRKTDDYLKESLEVVKNIAASYIHKWDREINLKDGGKYKIEPKNLEGFINKLKNGDKELLYIIVYRCYNTEPDQPKISRTYEKKIKAIESLLNKNVEVKNADKLIHIMKYYLAVKLIRNRVNHASEKDISDDEKKAIDKMKEYGIDINMEFENIKKILLCGIEEE